MKSLNSWAPSPPPESLTVVLALELGFPGTEPEAGWRALFADDVFFLEFVA